MESPTRTHAPERVQENNLPSHYEAPEKDYAVPEARLESRLSRVQSAAAQDQHKLEEGTASSSDEAGSSLGSASNARTIRGIKWLLICAALYITCFLYGLDTTIAADLQGPIVEQFHRVDQLAWVGTGFPMGSVAMILPIGAAYSSFNLKRIFLASVLMFEIGSAVCGAAPSMDALIIGRVLAGMGGSGIYLGCLHYFTSLSTEKERGFYISLTGLCWGLGAVLGPVIGGLFADSPATWRWGFYINLVVGAVGAPVMLFWLPALHPVKGVSVRQRLANLDLVGFFLAAAVWTLFTVAFTVAGAKWPWSDGRTIALVVVWVVVVIVYALQQVFAVFTTEQTRSFPIHLLKLRAQVALVFATLGNITVLFVVVYFIPIYFQFTHNDSSLMAAVRLLPFIIVVVAMNVMIGRLLPHFRYYMPIYVFSGLLMTVGGAVLYANFSPNTSQGLIYGITVLVGIGCGLTVQLGYAVATIKAKPEDAGDAIALQNVTQIGGTVISLVIAGQIFQTFAVRLLANALEGQGFADEEIQGAVSGARSALFASLDDELREKAVIAITKAMQKSLALVIAGGAMNLLSGLAMKFERLFGDIVVAGG